MRATRVLLAAMFALTLASLGGCNWTTGLLDRALGDDDVEDCTFTQGFWKNHEEAWPVDTLTLGNVSYTQDELLAIFDLPVEGNCLISLAHQLIAAKLNVANGADDDDVADAIAAADALIGDLVVGEDSLACGDDISALIDALTTFNETEGDTCAGPECGDGTLDEGEECDDGNTEDGDGCSATCENEPACGDGNLDAGEECDDGNTEDGDGCSATCENEPECGDGNLDAGEECDDGNNTDGDGCSATCETEPACGDGNLDAGEECDDGNTTDGDGCSSDCTVETNAECGNGVVEPGEECDDGNTDDNDACSNACTIQTAPIP